MAYACPFVVEGERRVVLGTSFHPANSGEPSFMDGNVAVRESEAHALMGLRRSSTSLDVGGTNRPTTTQIDGYKCSWDGRASGYESSSRST